MRVVIVRRTPQASFSMDVYADGLVKGLRAVRPTWEIIESAPHPARSSKKSLLAGIQKYYERYWRYPATLKNQKADVFHIIDHSDGHFMYWLASCKQPKVITCHDLINFSQPENIYDQARLPFISLNVWKFAVRGLQKADQIITISDHTAKDAIHHLNVEPAQIKVVPCAVNSIFRPLPQSEIDAFRQQHGLSPETLCVLNVGSNHPRKNIASVLEVIKSLKALGLPVHFWKAGADFTAEQKAFIQAENFADCITYLGKPSEQALVQIYNAADFLLAPSLYEGFGMTLLEAMACGTPVVTSNVTSLPEVAGDAAILTHPTDVEAMVNAIFHLWSDATDRNSMREAGLARAKHFTWEMTAQQVAETYEKLIT